MHGRRLVPTKRDDNTTDTPDPILPLSSDEDFHFELLRVLGLAPYEGADISEVLIAANQITPGDMESFNKAFTDLADRVQQQAQDINVSRFPVSARNAYFKAASYFRSADFYLHGNWTDPRINSLWDKQLAAFDKALALIPVPGERVVLKACNFSIPVIFYGSGLPGKQPTLILGNGYDGSQEELYHVWVKAALERGMNVITYEGPGQPTVRRQQDLGFIPNWEAVVTPVVDYALTRKEVDADALGLVGLSFGGYLAPRAAAFEHRLAAVMAVDGLFKPGLQTLLQFPPEMQAMFNSSNATGFNFYMNQFLASPDAETSIIWAIQQGEWSFKGLTPFEWLSKWVTYDLSDVVDKITVPVFVGDPEGDMFFAGQPKLLVDHLGSLATHHVFESAYGAGEHCSMGASILQNQVIFDWFQDLVAKGRQ